MNFPSVAPRLLSVAALCAAASCLLFSSGCGKDRAAAAAEAPPQSLSEPIRADASEPSEPSQPSEPQAIPVSNSDAYTAQSTGQSRELPVFIPPNASQPAASAPADVVPLDPAASAPRSASADSGKVHMLKKGETLYALSRLYHVKVRDIIALNNFKDPSKLSVGTKVYIPN